MSAKKLFEDDGMDWDFGAADEPRSGPPPVPGKRGITVVKVADAAGKPVKPPGYLPGVSNPNSPMRPGQKRTPFSKKEGSTGGDVMGFQGSGDNIDEADYDGPERRGIATSPNGGVPQTLGTQPNRRRRADTLPVPWQVTIPGDGTYKVELPPGLDIEAVKREFIQWWQENNPHKPLSPNAIHLVPASPNEAVLNRMREAINKRIKEIVRKKPGGGGYNLFPPNKGKKKAAKPVGEFPTRLAAKKAELARFPPKDIEQLKKLRTRLDKISKDPEKRAAAEKPDLTGRKKAKKSGAPAGERKKKTEALLQRMVGDLTERLFREEEIPGSPWDEKISSMHPDALASDKRLHSLHRGIEKASIGALGDAHRGLSKALKGIAMAHPGDIDTDPNRRKMFMPVMLDCDGTEIGPVHLYVDGGHIKIEISQDARAQIAELEHELARNLRGGMMSFQEDHLPKIVGAKKAWDARDSYLDKLHAGLETHMNDMSGVQHHLLKHIMGRRRPGR